MVPETDPIGAISALGEPTRRALYDYVTSAGRWVTRDEAADALDLERATAAHHLDRLADDGLLDVDFQRRSGRQGPGAGRPSKLYRRARRDFEVALPPRAYELAGQLLAEAVDRVREGAELNAAVNEISSRAGSELADKVSARMPMRAGKNERREVVLSVLKEHGYEPQDDDGDVVLRNCPFHHLARSHTDLICGMNHCMLRTAVDQVGGTGFKATLEPHDETCCVRLRHT
jgi:predicted ArsR family transcriptional regulator